MWWMTLSIILSAPKNFLHISHIYGFSQVCLPRWRFSCCFVENDLPHTEHLYSFSALWVRRFPSDHMKMYSCHTHKIHVSPDTAIIWCRWQPCPIVLFSQAERSKGCISWKRSQTSLCHPEVPYQVHWRLPLYPNPHWYCKQVVR